MGRRRSALVAIVTLISLLPAVAATTSASAQTGLSLPPGFQSEVIAEQRIFAPTLMTFLPNGDILISQQTGRIKLWHAPDGEVRSTAFLTIPTISTTDRGILGVAVDPEFSTNRHIYVYYHPDETPLRGVISRFTVRPDLLTADPATEVRIYEMDTLSANGVHTGGSMEFGTDGMLYVAVGDDARGVEVSHSLSSDLGKVLRINRDGTIPSDNPFVGVAAGKYQSIWTKGHRNPYTWGFNSAGDMILAEVGLNLYEELNRIEPGLDYGWPTHEGPDGGDPDYEDPVYYYPHGSGTDAGCAVIGGDFADAGTSTFPAAYHGRFFFADYCNGWMKAFDPVTGQAEPFGTGVVTPTHLRFGPDGNLYYLMRNTSGDGGSGTITRITYTGSDAPVIAQQPQDQTISVGQDATFTVQASGALPLSFQWHRDGTPVPGATASTYIVIGASLADDGAVFSVDVTNTFGSVTSDTAQLHVVANQPPVAVIDLPDPSSMYSAGDVISFAGRGIDPEDGELPPSALDWNIVFHHADHSHPFWDPDPGTIGSGGDFTAPVDNFETSANVWFRINLRVTDSSGLTGAAFVDIHPNTHTLRLLASPWGANVSLEGTLYPTTHIVEGVNGLTRVLGAPDQTVSGRSWVFDHWSDDGARNHDVSPDGGNSWFFAVYRLNAGAVSTGQGLSATYFDDTDLTQPVVTQIDAAPLLNVPANSSPAPGVQAGTWSVRWEGELVPQFSEATTFRVVADDGVRLWVNGQLMIDQWAAGAAAVHDSAPLNLVGGVAVPIRMEMRQGSARVGQARLLWTSNSMPRSVIPSSQLHPAGAVDTQAPTGAVLTPPENSVIPDGNIEVAGNASDNVGVASVTVAVRDIGRRLWRQPDGTFTPSFYQATANLSNPNQLVTDWSFSVDGLPDGSYGLVVRAFDAAGNRGTIDSFYTLQVDTQPEDTTDPVTTVSFPARDEVVGIGTVNVEGTATDDIGVVRTAVAIRDRDSKQWLQPDMTFGTAFHQFNAALQSPGSTTTEWTLAIDLPPGRFAVSARSFDDAGNRDPTRAWVPFVVSATSTGATSL